MIRAVQRVEGVTVDSAINEKGVLEICVNGSLISYKTRWELIAMRVFWMMAGCGLGYMVRVLM